MEIITREEAIKKGNIYYFTGKPCKHGHIAERTCLNGVCIECSKLRRQNNKESIAKNKKKYYENNKESIAKTRKKYYKNNEEGIRRRESVKYDTIKGRVNQLFYRAKARSLKKKLEFNITREWIIEKITNGKCELTGIPFILYRSDKYSTHPYSPSIDRIDSSKGYFEDNCRMIVSSLNMALNEYGDENFIKLVLIYLENKGYKISLDNL